jgi:hypothetical protein
MRHPGEWMIALVGFLILFGMLSFVAIAPFQSDQSADASQGRSQTAEQK